MTIFNKILPIFIAIQMMISSGVAEASSHVAYVYAFTGKGLSENINQELERIQEKSILENKHFEFVNITFTKHPDFSCLCILYNLSEADPNPFTTKIAYASSWVSSGIYESIQEKIDVLQNQAMTENKAINFLDIKITANGIAFIIYEISNTL